MLSETQKKDFATTADLTVAKVLNFWDKMYFVPLTLGIKKKAFTLHDEKAGVEFQEQQARLSIALEPDADFPESRTPLSTEQDKVSDKPSTSESDSQSRANREESGEAVWKYTTTKLQSANPDEAVYYAEWSEPSKLTPFPRAKAGVKFTISIKGRISYQFENHRLVHSHEFPDINNVSDAVFESELERTLASAPDIVDKASGEAEPAGLDGASFSMIANQMASQSKTLDPIELSKLKYNFITKSTLGTPSKRIVDIINAKLRVSDDIAAGAIMGGEKVPGLEKDEGFDSEDELSGILSKDLDDITPPKSYTAKELMNRTGIDRFREPLEESLASEFDEDNLNNPKIAFRNAKRALDLMITEGLQLQPMKSREEVQKAFDNLVLPEEVEEDLEATKLMSSQYSMGTKSSFSEERSTETRENSVSGNSDKAPTESVVSTNSDLEGSAAKKGSVSRFERRMKSKRNSSSVSIGSPPSTRSSRANSVEAKSADTRGRTASMSQRDAGSAGSAESGREKIEEETEEKGHSAGNDVVDDGELVKSHTPGNPVDQNHESEKKQGEDANKESQEGREKEANPTVLEDVVEMKDHTEDIEVEPDQVEDTVEAKQVEEEEALVEMVATEEYVAEFEAEITEEPTKEESIEEQVKEESSEASVIHFDNETEVVDAKIEETLGISSQLTTHKENTDSKPASGQYEEDTSRPSYTPIPQKPTSANSLSKSLSNLSYSRPVSGRSSLKGSRPNSRPGVNRSISFAEDLNDRRSSLGSRAGSALSISGRSSLGKIGSAGQDGRGEWETRSSFTPGSRPMSGKSRAVVLDSSDDEKVSNDEWQSRPSSSRPKSGRARE